ncbi:MAG: carbohydrate kinase [Bacilli bacterium]|nr:carbohydrate kinase [Bacilli bacterium]
MNKLYSLGELLIDFQSVGTGSLKTTEQFVKKAGGAPANVCAQAVKLGCKATYLTKVGKDGFGDFLIDSLKAIDIDTRYIKQDEDYDTSLAFVSFQKDGEREFSFYRKMAADLHFTPNDFKDVEINKDDIFEFGSVALASEEARQTHDYLIGKAKSVGAIVAFDPNLRFNLWKDPNELKEVVNKYREYADVMKIGRDELEFVTDKTGEEAVEQVLRGNLKVLLVTDGSHGAKLYTKHKCYHCPGYKVKAVDTTGAGDSFFGAFLGQLLKCQVKKEELENDNNDYQYMLEFACKAGAFTTMNYGAIPAMGDQDTIERTVK